MITAWIRHMFDKASSSPMRKLTRRPAKFKPAVFPLEDRCVPATYTVNNTGDAPGPFAADGIVTLREALTAATNTVGTFGDLTADAAADIINFAAPLNGQTINLTGFTSAPNGSSYFLIN